MGYSLDFRKRVLAYKDKHSLTFEQTSDHFDISMRTLFRWSHKIEPCMTRDKPPTKISDEALIADVQHFPDDYQWERAKRLGVSQSAIHYALKRLQLTVKKTLNHPSADPQARQAFIERIHGYEQAGKPIVYLDESGFAQSMPRLHGYSKKGLRCFGTHDWHAKGRVNVIGAIIKNTILTLSLFTGNINADVFHAWVTQDLLPKVPSGAVIVMDNAPFHKRHDTIQAIADSRCQLEWLPPYSPDLNPIEHKWAGVKAIRREKRCSVDELFMEHVERVKLY